jgi:hypothetical protein
MARTLLAAQLALIVALAVAISLNRRADQTFTTASGGAGETAGVRLTVMFAPTATEEAIRTALQNVDAGIVSGPSAAGVYVVQLRGRAEDDPAVDQAIQTLRSESPVVRFVEREP